MHLLRLKLKVILKVIISNRKVKEVAALSNTSISSSNRKSPY